MSQGPYYILDQNVFIQAKNQYYGFAFCPGFWDAIVKNHQLGKVRCIDKMLEGLVGYGDDLSDWIKRALPEDCFMSTESDAIVEAYSEIMEWAHSSDQFYPYAKEEFAKEEDAWIAAFALVNGHKVVTQEVYNPERKSKISLAHVCEDFGIKYMNTFEFLEDVGVSMVFDP